MVHCRKIDAQSAGQEVEALWQEYEDGQTAEAMLVKDFDKAS